MSDPLASFVPQLVVRRLAANPAEPRASAEPFPAAILFADVSGFTALSETLAKRGAIGAEQLTDLLNDYFGQVVATIAAHGGDIVKFAGDALLAMWGDAARAEPLETLARRAAQCAVAVRDAMRDWKHADGHRLVLRMTIGAGDVTALHLGGVFDRWECVIAGPPLAQIAAADRLGNAGDITVAAATADLLRPAIAGESLTEGAMRLDAVTSPLAPRALEIRAFPSSDAGRIRSFVPRAVLNRLAENETEWVGELRRLSVLFINLPGVDFADPNALDLAQAATEAVQHGLYGFEGSLNKLLVDDKGTTFVAAFGLPPLFHEDDAARAVRAALAIQRRLAEGPGLASSIGVASGRVFCGLVGSTKRREYTMIGDVVNLAARLMQTAANGVLCDEFTAAAAESGMAFRALPPITVKGKRDALPVFRPLTATRATQRTMAPMVGRSAEQQALSEAMNDATAGIGRVILIEGEAGIGKSQLINHALKTAALFDLRAVIGGGDSIDRDRPYHAWQSIFRMLFLPDATAETDRLGPTDRASARARIEAALPVDHRRLAPLLNAMLPLDWPETDTTHPMTGKVRAENTREAALCALNSAASERPLMILLEDAHWLDSASWAFAALACRSLSHVLFIITTRPFTETIPLEYRQLITDSRTAHFRLSPLAAADSARLVCQRLGVRSLPAEVENLIHRRAEGHPFFSVELAFALRDAGVLRVENGVCELAAENLDALDLPDTIQGAITSRIDRLTPAHQLAVKSASVIGRVFEFAALHAVYPLDDERARLPACMRVLDQLEITTQTAPEPTAAYAFRHIITQQVAYDLMLFSQRRRLHRAVAEWIERRYEADLAPHYQILAHHWRQADDVPRAVDYAICAGEQALHGGSYAEAIKFFTTALDLAGDAHPIEPFRRAKIERKLGDAYMGLGQMPPCNTTLQRAAKALGMPTPTGRMKLVASLFREIATQFSHAIKPKRLSSAPIAPDEVSPAARDLEGARIFEGLARTFVWSDDKIAGIHAAIRTVNLAERAGRKSPELARAYANIAYAAGISRLHRLARHYAARAVSIAEGTGNELAVAWALEVTGVYWMTVADWRRARENFTRAIALCDEHDDHRLKGENQEVLASALYHQEPFAEGLRLREDLGRAAKVRGDRQQLVWALRGQALSWLRLGRPRHAIKLLGEATALLELNPDRLASIFCSGLLSLAHFHAGDAQAAQHQAEQALDVLRHSTLVHFGTLEAHSAVAEVFLRIAENCLATDPNRARHCLTHARDACAGMQRYSRVFRIGQPRAWLWQGLLNWLQGRQWAALRAWHTSRDWAVRLHMPFDEALACSQLATHLSLAKSRETFLHQAEEIFLRLDAPTELAHVQTMLRGENSG